MTNEEKNNLISYLKKYKKIDTQTNSMLILMFIFSLTLFAFIGTNQKIWSILNLITLILLIISIFIIAHNQNQIAKNIFLLLKDYNVITINEKIIEVYNEQDLINAAKNNQTIDLSTNCEKSVSEAIDARNTSVINLLKNNPDVKKVTKIKQTYTVNELILDYQKDINKICDENIPKTIIKYETTKPIGKAELKNRKGNKMITFELGVTENFKTIDIKTKKDYNELLEKLNEIIDKENEDIENISIKNTKGVYLIYGLEFGMGTVEEFKDIVIFFEKENVTFNDFIKTLMKINDYDQYLGSEHNVFIYDSIDHYINENLPHDPFEYMYDLTNSYKAEIGDKPLSEYYNLEAIKKNLKTAKNAVILSDNRYLVFQ